MGTFFSFLIPVAILSFIAFMFIPMPFILILAFSVIVSLLITIINILKGNNDDIQKVSNEEIERELEQNENK
jgi:hypothetical protein